MLSEMAPVDTIPMLVAVPGSSEARYGPSSLHLRATEGLILTRPPQIKVKSLASATGLTETGLEFSDGTHLDADVIVLCTGFHTNMRLEALKILGADMYDQLDDFWGIDGEGELRGAFKRMKRKWPCHASVNDQLTDYA